ncbi:MAG: hypothetical protein ACF8PN_10360 [Phycisphaerales bacterium]
MQKRMLARLAAAITVCAVTGMSWGQTTPPWSDDFESYAVGSGIAGQGGWEAWDQSAAADSRVTDAEARSGTRSLDIEGPSDTIMRFNGVNSGVWVLTAWVYVPSNYSGTHDFLVLNEYNHLGPYNWSTWVYFDSGTGMLVDERTLAMLPYVTDAWSKIEMTIDLDANTQSFYYEDVALYEGKSWTEGWSGGGLSEVQCLDLYADGSTSIYYDDISFDRGAGGPCLSLDNSNSFAGLPVEFCADGGVAGQRVAIFYSFDRRAFDAFEDCWTNCRDNGGGAIQCGEFCLGTTFNNQVASGRFDSTGEFCETVAVPCNAGGRTIYFMAISVNPDGSLCLSPVLEVTWTPC